MLFLQQIINADGIDLQKGNSGNMKTKIASFNNGKIQDAKFWYNFPGN